MLTTLLAHPIGQAISLLFGVFNLITGLTRKGLNLYIHINAGLIFCFSVIIGAGLGRFVTVWMMQKHDIVLLTSFHRITSFVMIVLVTLIPVTGFLFLKLKNRNYFILHRIAGSSSLFIFFVQIFSGIVILKAV